MPDPSAVERAAAALYSTWKIADNVSDGVPSITELAQAALDAVGFATLTDEVAGLRGYKPCAPCLADDHDNCTGDCPSLCCALDSAEAQLEEARKVVAALDEMRTYVAQESVWQYVTPKHSAPLGPLATAVKDSLMEHGDDLRNMGHAHARLDANARYYIARLVLATIAKTLDATLSPKEEA